MGKKSSWLNWEAKGKWLHVKRREKTRDDFVHLASVFAGGLALKLFLFVYQRKNIQIVPKKIIFPVH